MRSGYTKHLFQNITKKGAQQAATTVAPEILAAQTISNISTRKTKQQIHNKHPYATISKAVYERGSGRHVLGYDIDPELSGDDVTVYKQRGGNDVIVGFRGTDIKKKYEKRGPMNARDIFSSRGFRDVFADASLAAYSPELNHRFYKAKVVTQKAIAKYGKSNIITTGHSLGGSQSLYVSNELDVPSIAYSPFVHPIDVGLQTTFKNATIRANSGDPISIASPFANASRIEIDHSSFGSHSLDNWIQKEEKRGIGSLPNPPKSLPPGSFAIQ